MLFRSRIDDFLAQFQALKVQSACPNEYAKDLLKRAVQQKVLEQVVGTVCTVGRAQELFLINMASPTRYFGTNNYSTSSSTPSGSGAPMDISAANTRPQCGKGIQCYNCQGFRPYFPRVLTALTGLATRATTRMGCTAPGRP